MAHNTLLEIIDASGCPSSCPTIPTNLVPGKQYKVTGLSQGALGNYSFIAVATSNTTLSNDVTVLPDNVLNAGESWYGQFDYGIWELTWLRDSLNNSVSFNGNISEFKWFDYDVDENTVDTSARLYLGGNTWVGTFSGNRVSGRSIVHLDAVATQAGKTITHNIWDTKSEVTLLATRGSISYVNNIHTNGSVINIENTGDLIVRGLTISNSEFDITNTQFTRIEGNSLIDDAYVTLTDISNNINFHNNLVESTSSFTIANVGLCYVQRNTLLSNSNLDFNTTGNISLSNNLFTNNCVGSCNGIANYLIERSILSNGIILSDVDTVGSFELVHAYIKSGYIHLEGDTASTLESINITDGVLTPDGHTATNINLEGVSSILVANISDATKNGYSNPLP